MSMLSFLNFFNKYYERYLDPNSQISPQLTPVDLINQVSPRALKNQSKKFIQKIKKQTSNGARVIRTLTVLHILIIYSNDFYDLVDNILPINHFVKDEWLIKHIINPYTQFLKKVCSSRQMYTKCKKTEYINVSFQNTFYMINLMTQLFKSVQKMSLLGRYYKQSNSNTTCFFVETVAVQAQRLYSNFKYSLMQMVNYPKKYIPDKNAQKLMKSILSESLLTINEQMKKLFLDKYFYPYGKGIIIKLFRLQDQTQGYQKTIKAILTDHQQTQRKNQYKQLEKNLFPKEGEFNINFYEKSLMPTVVFNNNDEDLQDISIEENDETPKYGFDITIRGEQQKQNLQSTVQVINQQ